MRYLGISFILIAFIIYVFTSNYEGNNYWFILIPLPLSIIIFLFGLSIILFWEQILQRRRTLVLQKFKKNAKKIKVELDDCKVLSNTYQKEKETNHFSEGQAMYDLQYRNRNIEKTIVNKSVVVYQLNTKSYSSVPIQKDRITLGFLFEKQIYTYLYIDKNNPDNYYFDFEFIEP